MPYNMNIDQARQGAALLADRQNKARIIYRTRRGEIRYCLATWWETAGRRRGEFIETVHPVRLVSAQQVFAALRAAL